MEENRTQTVTNERNRLRERITKMEEQQQKLLDDRLEGLIDKDLCYKKLSQIQRDLDLGNVRLKEIQDDNNANYMALNKTIDVLGDLYQLYKNSDTPTRHMYHRAFFDAIVVDQKKIVDLKWKVPFSALYQSNSRSVLQPFGERLSKNSNSLPIAKVGGAPLFAPPSIRSAFGLALCIFCLKTKCARFLLL